MKTQTIQLDLQREAVTLSALLWEPSPALQDASRPRPGLLILPGGGYQSHAHREADPIAVRFAAMGYHTFVLRYSLRPADGSCLYPQPLVDVARAMLYIRAHAEEWCLDASRVGICGFSAGGHAALLYAASWQRAWLQEHLDNPGEALLQAGVPVETHIFEAGEHGLALACPASAGIRRKVEPEAARWVDLCEAWLSKRFALTLMDE